MQICFNSGSSQTTKASKADGTAKRFTILFVVLCLDRHKIGPQSPDSLPAYSGRLRTRVDGTANGSEGKSPGVPVERGSNFRPYDAIEIWGLRKKRQAIKDCLAGCDYSRGASAPEACVASERRLRRSRKRNTKGEEFCAVRIALSV